MSLESIVGPKFELGFLRPLYRITAMVSMLRRGKFEGGEFDGIG